MDDDIFMLDLPDCGCKEVSCLLVYETLCFDYLNFDNYKKSSFAWFPVTKVD